MIANSIVNANVIKGDEPSGWGMHFRIVQQRNPHLKFLLPCAPIAPVTLNGGWSIIFALFKQYRNEDDFLA